MFQDSKGEYYPSDTPHWPLLQVLCFSSTSSHQSGVVFQDSKGEYYPSDTPHWPLLTNQVLCFRIARESTTPVTRLIGRRFLTWSWIPSSVTSPFSIIALGPSPSRDRHHGFLSPLVVPDLCYFVLLFLISLLHSFVNCFKHLKTFWKRGDCFMDFIVCLMHFHFSLSFFSTLYACVCVCVRASCSLCLNPCWCVHYVIAFAILKMTFSVSVYIMCVMSVQCFKPWGRRFTNLHYIIIIITTSQAVLKPLV